MSLKPGAHAPLLSTFSARIFAQQIVSASLALALATPAFAATTAAHKPTPKPTPKPATHASTSHSSGDSAFHVNPGTLRKRLLTDDTDVLESLNGLYQAKKVVEVAHGNLMPSINVGALISTSFSLSSVSFLLPFLLPSNWYALDASKAQLSATGYAYYIVELNAYASGLAAYQTVINDMELRDVYRHQYEIYLQIQKVATTAVQIGKDTPENLQEATADAQNAAAALEKAQEQIDAETAALRRLLGVSLTTPIVFDDYHAPKSAYENNSPNSVLSTTYANSPEYLQVLSLVKASQAQSWEQAFSFLNSATLSFGNNAGGGVNFGSVSGNASANLGFATFPNIQLRNLNTDFYILREKSIKLEEAQTIETTIRSIAQARSQVINLQQSEANLENAINSFVGQYAIGRTDLQRVLTTVTQLTSVSLNRASAQNDLDNQRVDLMRITRSDVFRYIPGCVFQGDETADGGFFGWLTDLFSPTATEVTVDRVCRIDPRAGSQAAPSAHNIGPTDYDIHNTPQ